MLDFLARLREVATIGIVGGSDLVKIKEQLGEDGPLQCLAGGRPPYALQCMHCEVWRAPYDLFVFRLPKSCTGSTLSFLRTG